MIFTPTAITAIIADYQSGMTLSAIAKKHYTNHVTIINYLKRAGIKRRNQGGRNESKMDN